MSSTFVDQQLIDRLIAAAVRARTMAYAPYSKFQVGATLLAADGQVFTGCNVENASYGHTVCAERVALLKAISEGSRDFSFLVVVSTGKGGCWPCGACRQMLVEFSPGCQVATVGPGGLETKSLKELLPDYFSSKCLT